MIDTPDMTSGLEEEIFARFRKYHEELLQRGRREALGDGQEPLGGQVAYTAQYEGYELFLSYTSEPDEDLVLIGGRKF